MGRQVMWHLPAWHLPAWHRQNVIIRMAVGPIAFASPSATTVCKPLPAIAALSIAQSTSSEGGSGVCEARCAVQRTGRSLIALAQ